jgi:MoxR-like ATPase
MYVKLQGTTTGKQQWRSAEKSEYLSVTPGEVSAALIIPTVKDTQGEEVQTDADEVITGYGQAQVQEIINKCYSLKPNWLIMRKHTWKLGFRTMIRGGAMMFRGPAGYGKTVLMRELARAFGRPYFEFHLGSVSDPRGFLIGNTHYDPVKGTYVAFSEFLRAIQTPNAVIGLDEIARAHPDTANVILPILSQRFVRVDEAPGTPEIFVADGVSFFATRNSGVEYTGNRTVDRALLDRFDEVDIDPPPRDSEFDLLTRLYPDVPTNQIAAVADLADSLRQEKSKPNARINTAPSTRVTVRMGGLLNDGFDLSEVVEISVFPIYSDAGGVTSDRTYVRGLVQQYLTPVYSPDVVTGGSAVDPTENEGRPWT